MDKPRKTKQLTRWVIILIAPILFSQSCYNKIGKKVVEKNSKLKGLLILYRPPIHSNIVPLTDILIISSIKSLSELSSKDTLVALDSDIRNLGIDYQLHNCTLGYKGERISVGSLNIDQIKIDSLKNSTSFFFRALYLEEFDKEIMIKVISDSQIKIDRDNFEFDHCL